jgi:hypothetical protein
MADATLSESDLAGFERLALAGESALHQAASKLAAEVVRLRHALADPSFMYAGGRIHRHALVCRNEKIDQLLDEVKALKAERAGDHGAALTINQLREAVADLLAAGSRLSNCCYNAAQAGGFKDAATGAKPHEVVETLRRTVAEWDAAERKADGLLAGGGSHTTEKGGGRGTQAG